MRPPTPGERPHDRHSRLERGIERLSQALAWLIVPALLGTTLADVLRRQLYHVGSEALTTVQAALFVALVMLPLGQAYLRDAHVRIDILRERWRPRTLAGIELIGILTVLLPLCLLLIVYGGDIAWSALEQGEHLDAFPELPLAWLVKATVPAGFLMLLLAGLATLAHNLRFLRGRTSEPAPGRGEE